MSPLLTRGRLARTQVRQRVDRAVGHVLADAARVDVADADRRQVGRVHLGAEAEGRAAAGDAEGLGRAIVLALAFSVKFACEVRGHHVHVQAVGLHGGAVDRHAWRCGP